MREELEVELVVHSPLDEPGGISRYTRELHRHLSERISVRLVHPIDPPLARRFSFLHHLPLGLAGHKPGSVVHFTQIMGCALMLWRPVHPAVATVHDLGGLEWSPEWKAHRPPDRLLLRLSLQGLRRVDRIVADSDATTQSVVKHLNVPVSNAVTITLGVDRSLFRHVPRAKADLVQKYGLAGIKDRFWLLYVGSEAPRKNLGTLLEALARLRAAGNRPVLVKVGAGGHPSFRAALQEQIRRLRLEDSVWLVGSVPDEDLPLFYSAADLYIQPSYVEGFGLPVLEAMACGTPVVCSDSGALPEIVGDCALVAPSESVQGFAEAISALTADTELRKRLSRAGREWSAQFAWRETARATELVYRNLKATLGA